MTDNTDRIVALMGHAKDELTEPEQEWVSDLAKLIAIGYGSGRPGKPSVHIRAGIYAGVMAALFATIHRMAEKDGDGQMFSTGRDGAELAFRQAADKAKLLPLP